MITKPLNETEQNSLIAAEQSTLGGILINPACLEDVFEIVSPADFLTAAHRLIAGAMETLASQSQPLDLVTVAEELSRTDRLLAAGGPGYLAELYEETPGAANVRSYASVVADHSHRRQLLGALDEAGKAVYATPIQPVDHLLNEIQGSIAQIEKARDTGAGPQPLDGALKEWLRGLHDIESGTEIKRIYTGLQPLDDRWDGMRPSEVVIIGGPRGTGKTALAMQIAGTNAADNNRRVLVFSLEMSARQMAMRVSGMLGRLPVWMAEHRDKAVRAKFYAEYSDRLSLATQKLKGSPLLIDDQGGLHINQLMSRARRAHRKQPLGLIVVDYLQLVNSDGFNREQQVAMVSRSLKALAKELDVPVIALSQLNRDGLARESDGIENDADIVLKLHRDDLEGEESYNPGMVEAKTTKLRRGQCGKDCLHAKLAHYRFDIWTSEVYEAPAKQQKFQQFRG